MRCALTPYHPHPIVTWQLTGACELHCRNCALGAREHRDPNELTTYEAYQAIDQIADLAPRELVITGGDPLERTDLGQIIDYARRRGLDPGLVVSPTSRLTFDVVTRLQHNGLTRMMFALDGSTPEIHQDVRGVMGTFVETLRGMRWAEGAGLALEVNTLVCGRNAADLTAIADLIRPFRIRRWNVHFPVPVGRSKRAVEMITADETERLFGVLDEIRARERFAVRAVEALHYRRYSLQRNLDARLRDVARPQWSDFVSHDPESAQELLGAAVDGASGYVFVSPLGDVRASEFLPLSAGNLCYRPIGAIYRSSDLFVAMRDPQNLNGKCGRCEFRHICGGSRARAWAMTGDLFATDPLCADQPAAATLPDRQMEAGT
jgi:AdoMet-dependent heme synthase